MRAGEAAAKYAPAIAAVPIGLADPLIASIGFGMVAGWLALIGVLYHSEAPLRTIMRAVVTSLLIGGGGALISLYAVRQLNTDPLGAAMIAFGIAFSGVRAIKLAAGMTMKAVNWLIGSLIDDAARMGRERANAQKLLTENTRRDRVRLGLEPEEE